MISYPIFLDSRYRFLKDFTVKPDNYYFVGDYGEIQGMFSSEFEAALAKLLYDFGLIDRFIEGINLHVRSGYGLRTIDFRIFYVNSQGSLCSFLLECHPWLQADIMRCVSYTEIDRQKFFSIVRPEYQGERYYFIQQVKDVYKLLYFFNNHLSREAYDRYLIKEKDMNLLSFREKYLMYRNVDLEFYDHQRHMNYEDLLTVIPDKVIHRSKKVSELDLPDFVEFFKECESAVKDARINNPRRNLDRGYDLIKEKTRTNVSHNAFRKYRSDYLASLVGKTWLIKYILINFQLPQLFWMKMVNNLLSDYRFYIGFSFEKYLAMVTNRENPGLNLDEVNVRQLIIKIKNKAKKESFKDWLIESAEDMNISGYLSDKVLDAFLTEIEFV